MIDGIGTTTYGYNPIAIPPALGAGQLSSIDAPLAGTQKGSELIIDTRRSTLVRFFELESISEEANYFGAAE